MKARFTINDIKNSKVGHLNKHLVVEPCGNKPSKFRNTPTMVDGIRFDSKGEANRWKELKILLKAGEIGMLRRQVAYQLNPGGTFSYIYIPDFVYIDAKTGKEIVEDYKGHKTEEYKKKKKLMKKLYGITVLETK